MVIMSKIQRLLEEVDAPVKKAEDMRQLILLLSVKKNLSEFIRYFESLKLKKATTQGVQRRSDDARHAEAIREAMFELNFFRQCCSYGEKQGKDKKEFNFATPGNLNTLISHPFGDKAKAEWQKLFRSANDKRVVERTQRAHAVDVEASDDVKSPDSGESEAMESNIDPVCGPVQSIDDVKSSDSGSGESSAEMIIDPFFGPVKAKADPGVCGFRNLQNSCYMNAVLQCLAHLDPMRRALMENFDANKLNL